MNLPQDIEGLGSKLQSMGKRAPTLRMGRASDRLQIQGGSPISVEECVHCDKAVTVELKSDMHHTRFDIQDSVHEEALKPQDAHLESTETLQLRVASRCLALDLMRHLVGSRADKIYGLESVFH